MKKKFTKMTDLPPLLVFAVFAVCVLTVLLYGARIYGDLVRRGEETFRQRTAAQYITMRVQQAESVSVTDFGGCEALTIRENIDGKDYLTRVYCYDAYLRELFCAEGAALSVEDGEKVIAAEGLQLSLESDLLTVVVDGRVLYLQLRGKAGAVP